MPGTALPPSPDVEILSDATVWGGRFPLHLVEFRHRRFDGRMSAVRRWELWRRGRAAAVLPYDPIRDLVVVIEQFRLPALAAGLAPIMVELAAGLCDGDETPEATIRRESREEMGLEIDRLERIGGFLLTPGGCDEHCTLFAGRVRLGNLNEHSLGQPSLGEGSLIGHGGLDDEQEDIRVLAMPAEAAIARAVAGDYPNSVTTIGLLWLAASRERLRRCWTG